MFRLFFAVVVVATLYSCKKENKDFGLIANDPAIYHASVKSLTDVIIHDIFSPPVASRIYAYASIAGYEGARQMDTTYLSLADQVSHFPKVPTPEIGKEYCWPMVSTLAFLYTGKVLIFSEDSLQNAINRATTFYEKTGMPREVFDRSRIYAEAISAHVLDWASTDNYEQTRSFPKYSLRKDPSTWQPTPPGYMDGIEPSWNEIRTMVMDSASQFKPVPPPPFDIKDKNSLFYKEMMETYLAVKNADAEQTEIANFWDCNPYKLNVTGHVMHASKKITPGGHWINLVAVACKKDTSNFLKAAHAYANVSIALFDAFISCWDEKYRSVLVRPETVINENIDPEWLPLLQTPPFPEYTSGHSVASASAAVVLTALFGDNFAYDDDTEIEFGLPVRSFKSFNHAADEASISRLYGGIHYRSAIENGVKQGKAIGELVVEKIKCIQ